jgi:glycine/D-amino acid oxidase-like deaminating enzyme
LKIAVAGGGLFGATAAIHLARAGHEVHLYEPNEIMGAASAVNQARLHQGFHYPRSVATLSECQAALSSFRAEYGEAIIRTGRHYYAIAKEGSKVSGMEYVAFCMRHGLTFASGFRCNLINSQSVQATLSVDEARIDLEELRAIVERRLRKEGVTVHLEPATRSLRSEFDAIVIAAYAATNDVASELGASVEPFQFEVVEKPLVRMPSKFRDCGIVIMDGEFCCLDPYGHTGLHVMGHVKHAIHHANVGLTPEVPRHLKDYLNCGLVVAPEHTRFQAFIEAGREFIPGLADAEHVGSFYTTRAVLPNVDATDCRPTLVHRLDEKIVRIFSGKLGTAVLAAREVVSMVGVEKREAA